MSILVPFSISCLFHESSGSITEVEWYAEIAKLLYISMHGVLCHIDSIILWQIGEIVGEIEYRELTFGHAHLFTDIIDRVREDDGLGLIDIFGCKIDHPPHDISRIFTTREHTPDPVDGGIAVRVSEGLVHGGDEIVVLLAVLIVHEGFASSFEDRFSRECSFSLEDTGGFEEIQRIAEVSSSEFGDEGKWILLLSFARRKQASIFFSHRFFHTFVTKSIKSLGGRKTRSLRFSFFCFSSGSDSFFPRTLLSSLLSSEVDCWISFRNAMKIFREEFFYFVC